MSVTISTQQSDWNSNVYVVTVTRVLVGVGVFYLARSIVQLVKWTFAPETSHQRNPVRGEDNGMDMDNLAWDVLDLFGTASPAEMVELQLPQPSFNLRNILYRTRSLSTPASGPGSSTVPIDDIEAQTDGGTAPARGHAEGDTRRSA
ncbi:hypothetical protein JMJ35_006550 [Cladonia borealis]|uniref:Uncharacterized protein n=1 Tax=Cladonia borealis TaxID=184061 RepID=A0AA39R0B7_9LECA|nr:hypothetical protein JMJ35_006550 [Cladonia borealis]